jgi:ceramide glucosyltransferase
MSLSALTISEWFQLACLFWWSGSLLWLLATFFGALLQPWLQRRRAQWENLPPVSLIIPVKLLEGDFVASQASAFSQSYPDYEVIVSAAEHPSLALECAQRIGAMFPKIRARFMRSQIKIAVSPKLNNLYEPIAEAQNDIILMKDSNVELAPDDLTSFVRARTSGVGLVVAVPVAAEPANFGAMVETAILNGYQARILMLMGALGQGFGYGKIMLFSRSELQKAGGIEGMAWALGEDNAFAKAFKNIGLRTIFADRTARQVLGARRLRDVWDRQLRRIIIRRFNERLAFLAEPLGLALPTALAAAFAAPLFGFAPFSALLTTLFFWLLVETLLSVLKGWPVSIWSVPAFLAREFILIALWLRAWTTADVTWAGGTYRVTRGKTGQPSPIAGDRLPGEGPSL